MSQPPSPHAIWVREVASATLEKIEAVDAEIALLESLGQRAKSLIDESTYRSTQPLLHERDILVGQLASHAIRHRRTFWRYWGRTVELPNGIIKWRIIPRSLQTPKSAKSIVEKLLRMPGGMQYLNVNYTLDRRALATAPASLLRRLGASNHRQEQLSVMPTDADGTPKRDDPIELSRRRYPAAPRHIQD